MRILLPMVGICSLLSLMLGLWVFDELRAALLGQAGQRSESLFAVGRYSLEEEWERFEGHVRDVSRNGGVAEFLEREMVDRLTRALQVHAEKIGADLLQAFDEKGSLVAAYPESNSLETPAFVSSFVSRVLDGTAKGRMLSELPHTLLTLHNLAEAAPAPPLSVVAYGPVRDDFGDSHGWLFGYRFVRREEAMLRDLAREMGGELSILSQSSPEASLLPAVPWADTPTSEIILVDGHSMQFRSGALVGESGESTARLLAALPVDSFLEKAARARSGVLWGGGILVVVIFTVFSLTLRGPLRSITRLLAHMKKVGAGELGTNIDLSSGDELEELGHQVNHTVLALRDLIREVDISFRSVEEIERRLGEISSSLETGAASAEEAVAELDATVTHLSDMVDEVVSRMGTMSQSAEGNLEALRELSAYVGMMDEKAGEFASSAVETVSSVEAVSTSIAQVATTTTSVSDSLVAGSGAIDQIDSAVTEINELTADTLRVAEDVSLEIAKDGQTAVDQTRKDMERIRDVVESLVEAILRVDERSREIEVTIEMISTVADETGLLALNAAILAAQAGERGKGFAVVAQSIRDLSNRTRGSAEDVGRLIETIQGETRAAVIEAQRGAAAVSEGQEGIESMGHSLDRIAERAEETRAVMERIDSETTNQAAASSRVAPSLQKTAVLAAEVSAAVSEQNGAVQRIVAISNARGEQANRMALLTSAQARTVKQIENGVDDTVRIANLIGKTAVGGSEQLARVLRIKSLVAKTAEENREKVASVRSLLNKLAEESERVRRRLQKFDID